MKMKFIPYLLLILSINHLNAQIKCEIGVNPNDCTNCKLSYKYINEIDTSLNPRIYIGNVDEKTANYFVRNYLKINDVPSEINEKKYNELYKNMKPLVKVFDNDSLIYEFETRFLPDYIDKINDLKIKSSQGFEIKKSIEILNDTCSNNLLGFYRFRMFDNQLAVYTEITQNLMIYDFETGKCNVFNLPDTFYFNQIKKKIKFSDQFIKKRNFYIKELNDQLPDGGISDWLYLNNKVYLSFVVNNYDNMLTEEQLHKNDNEVILSYNYYIAEFSILNNDLQLEKVKIFSKHSFDVNNTDVHISIFNNKPILLYKELPDSIKMKAYMLDSGFHSINYPYINSKFLHKEIFANTYINQFSTFKYNNYLIDNSKKKFVKLSPFTNDSIYNVDFIEYNDELYILMNEYKKKTGYIYKINFNNQSIEIIRKYQNFDTRTFDGCLYFDKQSKILNVIGMKNEKFQLIDRINLTTLKSETK